MHTSLCFDSRSSARRFTKLGTPTPARIHSVWKSPKTTHTATVILFSQTGDAGKTTVALDPVGGWRRQRSRVIVIDVGRKGRKENSWLDWSKQRPKEGLTRFFRVTGLTPPAPRRDALEIACADDNIATGGPPRFAVWMRSALLATDVALTPFQPSPSEEGASVEIRKLLEKARIFPPRPPPSLDPQSLRALRPDRPRKGHGARQSILPDTVRPRHPARGVRECSVQQSVSLEAP